jgi:hypothetical protein
MRTRGGSAEKWIDQATGYECLAWFNDMGFWCGYVGVPQGHPKFEVDYNQVDADVHGGLTFSDFIRENDSGTPGLWYFGFDCAHAGDVVKGIRGFSSIPGSTFKDLDYVKVEIASLATQLKALERTAEETKP